MTTPRTMAHLVERAVEAMGEGEVLGLLQSPVADTTPAPQPDAAKPLRREPPVAPRPGAVRPVLGLDLLARAGLRVLPDATRNRISEEVMVVQHQVLRSLQAADGQSGRSGRSVFGAKIILFTSARRGEGKTFCALNIAASLAASGAFPVVLVDADGQTASLSRLLHLEDAPGLQQAVAEGDGQALTEYLHPTAIPRLSILPFGRPAQGGVASGGSALAVAMRRLSFALSGQALILDVQPCLTSSDPATLASIADQVVLVVEAERTSRTQVEAALDLVDACPTLQLLLNRVQLSDHTSYGDVA